MVITVIEVVQSHFLRLIHLNWVDVKIIYTIYQLAQNLLYLAKRSHPFRLLNYTAYINLNQFYLYRLCEPISLSFQSHSFGIKFKSG